MAAAGTRLYELYRADPALEHAIVDVEPRLTRIVDAVIAGMRPSSTAAGDLHP